MVKLASQDASASISVAGWQARNGRLHYTSNAVTNGAKAKQPGRRLLPRSRTTLLLLDLLFLSGTIAALVDGVRDRLGFESFLAAQVFIIGMLVVSMSLMFAAGCYRYDALTNFSAAVTRLVVALAVSTFILVPLIHFGLGLFFYSPAIRSL